MMTPPIVATRAAPTRAPEEPALLVARAPVGPAPLAVRGEPAEPPTPTGQGEPAEPPRSATPEPPPPAAELATAQGERAGPPPRAVAPAVLLAPRPPPLYARTAMWRATKSATMGKQQSPVHSTVWRVSLRAPRQSSI